MRRLLLAAALAFPLGACAPYASYDTERYLPASYCIHGHSASCCPVCPRYRSGSSYASSAYSPPCDGGYASADPVHHTSDGGPAAAAAPPPAPAPASAPASHPRLDEGGKWGVHDPAANDSSSGGGKSPASGGKRY